MTHSKPLEDSFGRRVSYLRLSVTDRCDLRCQYCMSEKMQFLPKAQVLSYEEMQFLCEAFMRRGIRKIRISGGEPLVRKDIMQLMQGLGHHIGTGELDELALTTMPRKCRNTPRPWLIAASSGSISRSTRWTATPLPA